MTSEPLRRSRQWREVVQGAARYRRLRELRRHCTSLTGK